MLQGRKDTHQTNIISWFLGLEVYCTTCICKKANKNDILAARLLILYYIVQQAYDSLQYYIDKEHCCVLPEKVIAALGVFDVFNTEVNPLGKQFFSSEELNKLTLA